MSSRCSFRALQFQGGFTGDGVNRDEEISIAGFPAHPIWQGVTSIGDALSEADIDILHPRF